VTKDVSCLVIIIARYSDIAAVQFILNFLIFNASLHSALILFMRTLWAYSNLSECIGQTACSFKHYFVLLAFFLCKWCLRMFANTHLHKKNAFAYFALNVKCMF